MTPPNSRDNRNTSISDRRFELQNAAPMPPPTVMPITALAAGGVADATAVGITAAAAGADRPPTRWPHREGIAVAHAHLKPILSSIDRLHAGAEAWPMALPCAQHQIDPGMDHLVAQRAFRGLLGQRFQQRPGQHNFTAPASPDARATTIKPAVRLIRPSLQRTQLNGWPSTTKVPSKCSRLRR